MPGFPDKFMPFMEEPPGARMSTSAVLMYGRTVRALRNFTKLSLEKEPNRSQNNHVGAAPERGSGVV
jgi:hydrogenase small subunit